ncbi:hypothetical protein OSB04_012149 [Centaurea solstitialis]|uniref:Uncharacterized protein n=1 Tax=Centaurea solstitialis TaxID=347529 RepID=A0AA38TAV1_9ASTR|nr:hypothetical protein OSB04_012149 [Centaurea solstitialis]
MGDKQPMWTARRTAPAVATRPITKPNMDKEIKGQFLHMIKGLTFDGRSDSNPIVHVESFIDICDMFKTENTTDDAIRLRGVFMYKTPTQGYNLLEYMLIHNIDWKSDKCLQIPKLAEKISIDFDPTDEIAAMKNKQVGCEECNGPHLTKDCMNKPMMTPEEVGRISQTLSGRTQGELPTQTQVNPKVDASKAVMMVDGITKTKSWTDIYTKKYVPSDSDSAPEYDTDYESDLPEGITFTLNDLTLREPIYLDDEDDDCWEFNGYYKITTAILSEHRHAFSANLNRQGARKYLSFERGANSFLTICIWIHGFSCI